MSAPYPSQPGPQRDSPRYSQTGSQTGSQPNGPYGTASSGQAAGDGPAAAMRGFVVATLEEFVAEHAPGFALPRVMAGHPVGPEARADLVYTLGLLAGAGVRTVAGEPVEDVLRTLLAGIDGGATHTFFCYRIAETLARWGPFAGNPLLEGLPPAQVRQVEAACDGTAQIAELDTSLPRNYRPVLARCELARRALGLGTGDGVLEDLVERTRALFTEQSGGFVDDARHRAGRFDIYTVDSYLFAAPLADRLGDAWTRGARHALELVALVTAPNGAAIPWGRSAGALALCLTVEAAALGFEHGLIPEREAAAWRERAGRAFATLRRDWFSGGLIRAHQYRSPYASRGPARRLQMTLDCLGKLALAAAGLDRPAAPAPDGRGSGESTPAGGPVDRVLWFDDDRRHGVWSYRSPELAFVVPFVGATAADYLPAPQCPGLLEVPVGSALATGVPFAVQDGVTYAPAGAPTEVGKQPGGLTVEHAGWHRTGEVNARFDTAGWPARRRAVYRVRGRSLSVEEELWFDDVPDAVGLQIAESRDRPLRVTFDSDRPHTAGTLDTAGIAEFRSYWSELPRTHQIDVQPARRLTLRWTVAPKLRILSPATQHAYVHSLYGALADEVALLPWHYRAGSVEQELPECDGFHVHWPERMMPRQAELHRRLIAALKRRGVPILWTQHNLAPHEPGPEDEAIYRAWAAAADAVVHHSEYGLRTARRALPYSPSAQHHVIPHGCFGDPGSRLSGDERRAVEAELGLRHGVLRLGVVGAPRPDKHVGRVMEAVAGSAREDVELVVYSLGKGDSAPDDPRIVAEPYRHVPQRDYDARLSVIDVLVLPFGDRDGNGDDGDGDGNGNDEGRGGGSMLTTGTLADAIGRGLPCLTFPWPYLRESLGDAALPCGASAAELRRRLDTLTAAEIEEAARRTAALRPLHDWSRIGALHLQMWEALTSPRPSQERKGEPA